MLATARGSSTILSAAVAAAGAEREIFIETSRAIRAWGARAAMVVTPRPRGPLVPEPGKRRGLARADDDARHAAAEEPRDLVAGNAQALVARRGEGGLDRLLIAVVEGAASDEDLEERPVVGRPGLVAEGSLELGDVEEPVAQR